MLSIRAGSEDCVASTHDDRAKTLWLSMLLCTHLAITTVSFAQVQVAKEIRRSKSSLTLQDPDAYTNADRVVLLPYYSVIESLQAVI